MPRCAAAAALSAVCMMMATGGANDAAQERASSTASLRKPTTRACTDAHSDGQLKKERGKLLEAKEAFVLCADSACPPQVSAECEAMLSELLPNIPSILLTVRAEGRDVVHATIALDNKLLSEIPTRPLQLNPGTHTIRVTARGFLDATEQIVLRTREQERVVAFSLKRVASPASGDATAPPVASWVVGAAGLTILTAGAATAGIGLSLVGDLEQCKSQGCPSSQINEAKRTVGASNILLGLGAGTVAAAAIIWVVHAASASSEVAATDVAIRDGMLTFPF